MSARSDIRSLLEAKLRSISELDAFILDEYPEVSRRLPVQLDRVHKLNIFIESVTDLPEVAVKLNSWIKKQAGVMTQGVSIIGEIPPSIAFNHSIAKLRVWIITVCLCMLTAQLIFLLVAPAVGYPLDYRQAMNVLQLVLPVFLSYVGTATYWITRHYSARADKPADPLLVLLTRGPVLIYSVSALACFFTFGFSNRANAAIGEGMSFSALLTSIAVSLSILTVSTNAIVAYLFSIEVR